MRKGAAVHVDEVAEAIGKALQDAERISGQRISQPPLTLMDRMWSALILGRDCD